MAGGGTGGGAIAKVRAGVGFIQDSVERQAVLLHVIRHSKYALAAADGEMRGCVVHSLCECVCTFVCMRSRGEMHVPAHAPFCQGQMRLQMGRRY